MTKKNLFYTLALQKASKIGDITAKKLIEHCGTPEAIFKEKASVLKNIKGVGSYITNSIQNPLTLKNAEKELDYIEKNNIKHWYFKEENYPCRLKNCIDSPILLFYSGKINLKDQKILSIVGTRNITDFGKKICNELIEELSIINPVIISGFAYGTDITAHKAAIDNNLQTIGCIAHGLNQIYPKTHKKYIHNVEQNGGLITEFWSNSSPERENFIKRNRIIAGLSEATLVIESAEKGGSLITADIANSYNREVFAIPGRPEDKMSLGTNNLIKLQKAQLINSAADLIYYLNWNTKNQIKKEIQQELFIALNDMEKLIVSCLKDNGLTTLDHISNSCNLAIHSTSSALLNLELKGLIRPHPGKKYEYIG